MMKIKLPWPPTVNTYWRRVGSRTLISKKGRADRKHIDTIGLTHRWRQTGFGDARLAIRILACAPDRRARDLDNLLKSLLDSLSHAGLFDDDAQIDDLRIIRGPISPGQGYLEIEIETIDRQEHTHG